MWCDCVSDRLPYVVNRLQSSANVLPYGANLLLHHANVLPYGVNCLPHGANVLPQVHTFCCNAWMGLREALTDSVDD